MKNLCPVCGYDELKQPPTFDMICPCCGTQFGYDDFAVSHEDIRGAWLQSGAAWFSHKTPPPPGWSAEKQLSHARLLSRPTPIPSLA